MKAREILDALHSVAWFAGWEPSDIKRTESHLEQLQAELVEDGEEDNPALYLEMADVAYCYDAGDGDEDYVALLESYAAGSRGRFQPTDIVAGPGPSPDRGILRFTVDGRHFAIEYPRGTNVIEESFPEDVNRVLADLGIPQRFLYLPLVDSGVYLVFATPKLYRQAVKSGAIPREPPQL